MNGSMATMVEDGPTQTLEKSLHEAHHGKQVAETKVAAAQKALARGEDLVREAQAAVQQHDDAAREVAEAEAQRIADDAAGREAGPPDDGAGVRARSRQVFEARLADATRAVGLLQREVDVTKANLATATGNIDSVIQALFRERAELVATELIASEIIARDLRQMLIGIAGIWMPQGVRPAPIRLGTRAMRAINNLPLNDDRQPKTTPAHINPAHRFTRAFQQAIAALRDDPDAPLPGMED